MNNFTPETVAYLINKYNLKEMSENELADFFTEITTIGNRVPRKEQFARDMLGSTGTSPLQERIEFYNTVLQNVCKKLHYYGEAVEYIPTDAKFVGYRKSSNGDIIRNVSLTTFPKITDDLTLVFEYTTFDFRKTLNQVVPRKITKTLNVQAGLLRKDPIYIAQHAREKIRRAVALAEKQELEAAHEAMEKAQNYIKTIQARYDKKVKKVNARLRYKIQNRATPVSHKQ